MNSLKKEYDTENTENYGIGGGEDFEDFKNESFAIDKS